jgi:hypothetical protein
MKIVKTAFFIYILLIFSSCNEEKANPSRTFRMGFTPFPYDYTLTAVEETYTNIKTNGDIINHHFDNGVPWVEALSGEPFNDNIINDWNFRKSSTAPGLTVYVSVAALNGERNGMAKYRGQNDNMELPSPWNAYSFAAEEVKTAYVNYCKRVIDFFQPDYFNMNIEANLLHYLKPELWPPFVNFHQFVYDELKKTYPTLRIFSSITGAHLLEGFFDNNDITLQRLAALQILEYSDLYGVSFYPYMSKHLGEGYAQNVFDELFSISSKPLAIAEIGYPAQSFNLPVDNNMSVSVESDETKQKLFLEKLLEACTQRKAEFLIYFTFRDYDQLWQYLGAKEDITIAWRDTGFLDEAGMQRSSLALWRSYFEREYKK